jgi:hypothetical protein
MLTGAVDPDGASSPPVIRTPFKVRPLTQDVLPVERDLYDTQSTSTACSPAMSAESRHIQEMSPSNIVPTVFHKGRFEPDSIAEPPRYKKKRPRLVSPPEDMPTVREIIQDVVDKEKQSILTEHQEMCDEAEIRVAEAIDDGRTAIIEKTDECCDEIDDHGQKIREACEESCEMLQVDVACLEEASTVLKKTWARFSSASDSVVLTSGRLDCRLSHPSTLAARIIRGFRTSRYLRQGDNADKGCRYRFCKRLLSGQSRATERTSHRLVMGQFMVVTPEQETRIQRHSSIWWLRVDGRVSTPDANMCSDDRPLRKGVLNKRHGSTSLGSSTPLRKNVDVAESLLWKEECC